MGQRRSGRGPGDFDEKEIQRMRDARLEGLTLKQIAKHHGTSPTTVQRLIPGLKPIPLWPVKGPRATARIEREPVTADGTQIHETGRAGA